MFCNRGVFAAGRVPKWPKKLPAEAGNFGTFFSHKIIPLLQARVGWWEAEFRSRYWRRTVGEARSSLDLKLMILDRNQDIRWSVGSSLDLSVLALRGSIQVPRSFLVECSNKDQAGPEYRVYGYNLSNITTVQGQSFASCGRVSRARRCCL